MWPGRGIQLDSGRLFFPCYHREGENGETVCSHAIFSDDRGRTWQLGKNAGSGNGESQALQRRDGSIYLSARTAGTALKSVRSSRAGTGVLPGEKSDLTNSSMMHTARQASSSCRHTKENRTGCTVTRPVRNETT